MAKTKEDLIRIQNYYKNLIEKLRQEQEEYEKRLEKKEHSAMLKFIQPHKMKLEIQGNILKISEYQLSQFTGYSRTPEMIEKGKEKREETKERREKMDEEIQEFLKKYPDFTKDDKKIVAEYNKILEKYDFLKPRQDNEMRRIKEFKALVNANYEKFNRFITLSYKKNMQDIPLARKHFNDWAKKIKRKYPEFEYVCVIEFQERGSIHFHNLVHLRQGKKNTMTDREFEWLVNKTWEYGKLDHELVVAKYRGKKDKEQAESLGITSAKEKAIWNAGEYLTSYLKKNTQDPRLNSKKMFTSSQGLVRPVVIRDEQKIKELIELFGVRHKHQKAYEFETEYTGQTKVTYVNLLRDKNSTY